MTRLSILISTAVALGCATPPAGERQVTDHDEHAGHPPKLDEGHRHHGGQHRFDDAEAWAEHFDDPARDAWQKPDAVIAWMGLSPDATVVDLGAGTGYFAVRLARAVPEGLVLANDIEPDMVRYLGERATKEGLDNLRAVQGEPDNPQLDGPDPDDPGPIDVAFMCNVYHHIEDPAAFFARVGEHLGEGGRLVIVDFRKDAAEDAPGPPAAMRVAATQVEATLAEVGFVLSRADAELLPHQYVLEFTR